MSYGPNGGIVLTRGNGAVPSDTGALVSRMYRWLAGDSAARGIEGFRPGDPIGREPGVLEAERDWFVRSLDWETAPMLPSWRHRYAQMDFEGKRYYYEVVDPFLTGDIRYFKTLVGAHSSFSDGRGTVEEYAAAARESGYSLIVFTENFEQLTREDWDELVVACENSSTEEFVCLPGFDIMDPDGNHVIIIGPPEYPRASWLTPDGKRLAAVGRLEGRQVLRGQPADRRQRRARACGRRVGRGFDQDRGAQSDRRRDRRKGLDPCGDHRIPGSEATGCGRGGEHGVPGIGGPGSTWRAGRGGAGRPGGWA